MFRLRERNSDRIRYAVVCWDCGLLRGYDRKAQVNRAIIHAADGGINASDWYIESYEEGHPDPSGRDTCPGCPYPPAPAD